MFRRKTNGMTKDVRIKRAHAGSYSSTFTRAEAERTVIVEAKCGSDWTTIARLDTTNDSFEDDLAEAISKAEDRAAAMQAWAG